MDEEQYKDKPKSKEWSWARQARAHSLGMLPAPATSFSSGRGHGGPKIFFPTSASSSSSAFGPYAAQASVWSALRSRTRLTNLGVAVLSLVLSVSLLLNLRTYRATHVLGSDGIGVSLWSAQAGTPPSIERTINRDPRFQELDHLIMVPGHAIWVGNDVEAIEDDDQWVLQSMQKGGSVKSYIRHIEKGAELMREDPKALLVFSG